MRQIYFIFIFVLLVGCQAETTGEQYRTAATFVPTLSSLGSGAGTRVIDDKWTAGDLVGIGMSDAQSALPTEFKQYTPTNAPTDMGLTHKTVADILYFVDANMKYFTAFCPYDDTKHTPSDGTVSYTLTDQSTAAKMQAVDLVYANDGRGTKSDPSVTLDFKHKLSKLTVNVIDGRTDKTKTATVDLKINSVPTTATCDLKDGTITSSNPNVITPCKSATPPGAYLFSASAIIAPHTPSSSSGELAFGITIDGGSSIPITHSFSALAADFKFESGRAYSLTFTLNDISQLDAGKPVIVNWETGTIVWDGTDYSLSAPAEVTHYKDASTGNTMVIKTDHPGTPVASGAPVWLTGAVLTKTKPTSPYEWTLTYNVAPNNTVDDRAGTIRITVGTMTIITTVTQRRSNDYTATDGLSNCYIVRPGATISIPLTRAITHGGASPAASFTQAVLWADAACINTPTVTGTGQTAMLDVTAKDTPGNALIAVKVGITTVWSYHIWVTDYNPNAQNLYVNTFNTNNGGKRFVFMDRNLGATIAGTGSGIDKGLFYQWGRKDPFPATLAPDAAQPGGGIFKAEATNETKGTIAYAIQNPHIFLYNASGSYDWYHGGGDVAGNRNNELWGHSGGKSVYDPCPVGWRVPKNYNDANSGSDATSPWNGFTKNNGGTFSNGWTWGPNAAYPAAGLRYYSSGALNNVGTGGYYWSASPYSSSSVNATNLNFSSSSVNVYNNYNRAYGFSVRCVQE